MPRDKKHCRRTKYASEYPCLGQSRFEPMKTKAMDGVMWWRIWDNSRDDWLPGRKRKVRRELLLDMYFEFRRGSMPFEPDNGKFGIRWLKESSFDEAMKSHKVEAEE